MPGKKLRGGPEIHITCAPLIRCPHPVSLINAALSLLLVSSCTAIHCHERPILRKGKPMKCLRPILLILAFTFVSACAVVDTATQKISSLTGGTEPRTYYVGVPDLKLYPEPRFSKEHIAKLPLNEKLVRYKVERGFAYVKVASTGQAGWVNNAHLIGRKAAPKKATPQKGTLQRGSPEKGLAKKSPPEEDLIEAPSQPNPEIERHDASIFDAF